MLSQLRRVTQIIVPILLIVVLLLPAQPGAAQRGRRPRRATATVVRPSARLRARARKIARTPAMRRALRRAEAKRPRNLRPRSTSRAQRATRKRIVRESIPKRQSRKVRPRPVNRPIVQKRTRKKSVPKVRVKESASPVAVSIPKNMDASTRKQLESSYHDIELRRLKAIRTAQERARLDIAVANKEAQNRRNDVLKTVSSGRERSIVTNQILQQYVAANAAFARKDLEGALRNRTSDYVAVITQPKGKTKQMNLPETRKNYADFFKTMVSSKSKPEIVKIQIQGNQAVTTTREVGQIVINTKDKKKAVLKTVATSTDTWVKQGKVWRLKRSDNIHTDTSVNGKKVSE